MFANLNLTACALYFLPLFSPAKAKSTVLPLSRFLISSTRHLNRPGLSGGLYRREFQGPYSSIIGMGNPLRASGKQTARSIGIPIRHSFRPIRGATTRSIMRRQIKYPNSRRGGAIVVQITMWLCSAKTVSPQSSCYQHNI
jgi:hypothetical protein